MVEDSGSRVRRAVQELLDTFQYARIGHILVTSLTTLDTMLDKPGRMPMQIRLSDNTPPEARQETSSPPRVLDSSAGTEEEAVGLGSSRVEDSVGVSTTLLGVERSTVLLVVRSTVLLLLLLLARVDGSASTSAVDRVRKVVDEEVKSPMIGMLKLEGKPTGISMLTSTIVFVVVDDDDGADSRVEDEAGSEVGAAVSATVGDGMVAIEREDVVVVDSSSVELLWVLGAGEAVLDR